ncbi:hypothetical protein RB195_020824 [Necator americanus]|uniref:G-protein coupled receptors family 1 profile domain-containing protein n=1 Tax=Necator americanus TaxID=51031 RepID=A0ABR1CLU7_NECAM
MNYAELDAWNYVFFIFETTLNVLFIPIVCFLFYICITQKNLHVNFRSTLFVTGVGYLICAIHRLILVPTRMCCIAQRSTPFVNQLAIVQTIGIYIALFGWLFVAVERATATVFTNKYEANCTGWFMPTVLCSTVVFLTALVISIGAFKMVNNFDMYMMGINTFVIALCFVAFIIIMLFNKSAYRKRHNTMMQLGSRYQLDENIRGAFYVIPVALNDLLTKVIFICLMAYSIFFTDIPLGQDTTHLSHAYDVLSAYQRIFFGLALTLRSQKLDHIMRRETKTMKATANEAPAASNYHNELRAMWS